MARAAVTVDILSEQRHLAHAAFGEFVNLGDDIVKRAAELGAARVRDHAESAVFAAALHDRDERLDPVGARRRQAVKLFNLRKTHIHFARRFFLFLRGFFARGENAVQHRRQAVQGLRPENHVHIRRAPQNHRALLAGDAAADADDHLRAAQFQLPPLPELREDFFLRLFAHRAGVQQHQIRLARVGGGLVAVAGVQQIGHARRIVFVHLAAESFDVEFGHRRTGVGAGAEKPRREVFRGEL